MDESAEKPSGWLDEEPDMVADPDAVRPEDWDDEMDGEISSDFTFAVTNYNLLNWQATGSQHLLTTLPVLLHLGVDHGPGL